MNLFGIVTNGTMELPPNTSFHRKTKGAKYITWSEGCGITMYRRSFLQMEEGETIGRGGWLREIGETMPFPLGGGIRLLKIPQYIVAHIYF